VLLPPSRLLNGRTLSWRVGPEAPLPDGERLYRVLLALPPGWRLSAWAEGR
jgi:hypothetical protein